MEELSILTLTHFRTVQNVYNENFCNFKIMDNLKKLFFNVFERQTLFYFLFYELFCEMESSKIPSLDF